MNESSLHACTQLFDYYLIIDWGFSYEFSFLLLFLSLWFGLSLGIRRCFIMGSNGSLLARVAGFRSWNGTLWLNEYQYVHVKDRYVVSINGC
jgi:hypothetical protein